jgi:hypothetical protein
VSIRLAGTTLARLQLEGLVEAGRKRTATVARPSLEEAKEDFEVRRALEREVIRLVVARWKAEFGASLHDVRSFAQNLTLNCFREGGVSSVSERWRSECRQILYT